MRSMIRYGAIACFVLIAGYAIVAFAGAPLKGVDVKLGKNPGGSPAARTTTDHEGKFTFENLPEGKYDLYCSYEQCARAINTKGTGATVRTGSPEFEVELLPAEGVSFAAGPRQTTSMDGTRKGTSTNGVPSNGLPSNGSPLRVLLTSQSPGTSPVATITVAAKHKDLTGHVTLIK